MRIFRFLLLWLTYWACIFIALTTDNLVERVLVIVVIVCMFIIFVTEPLVRRY